MPWAEQGSSGGGRQWLATGGPARPCFGAALMPLAHFHRQPYAPDSSEALRFRIFEFQNRRRRMRGSGPGYARRLVQAIFAATLWLCFHSAGSVRGARGAGLVQRTLCPANCRKHPNPFPKAPHAEGCCGAPSVRPPASPTRLSLRGGSSAVAAAAGGLAGAVGRAEAQQVARMRGGDGKRGMAEVQAFSWRSPGAPFRHRTLISSCDSLIATP